MHNISRLLLLVDGQTEIKAIGAKFSKEYGMSPQFRKVDCNGKSVSAEGYANRAIPIIIAASGSACNFVLCIVDREQRHQSATAWAKSLAQECKKRLDMLLQCRKISSYPDFMFCAPDIMFENWIVADVEGIKTRVEYIKDTATQDHFDGKSGTTHLQRMMTTKYRKTFHGEVLFKSVRISVARLNSPSFENFCKALGV